MSNTPPIVPFSPSIPAKNQTGVVPAGTHVPNPLPFVVWLVIMGIGSLVFGFDFTKIATIVGWVLTAVFGSIVASTIRIAAQWEKALIFRLGRFHALKGPGPFFLIPFFESSRMVDTRIAVLDIPRRQAITKDNVPVALDGVIFMRVVDPGEAVTKVRNYEFAIQQYAQTALRDIIGSMTLDEVLADRELVGKKIEEMVESEIDGWGLEVAGIRIQDLELPEDLKRVMARQASAEREKRATITKAEGDRDAAENLAQAALTMAASPGALQLRTLQTLDGLGTSSSNTVVLAVPIEVVDALRAVPHFASLMADAKKIEVLESKNPVD